MTGAPLSSPGLVASTPLLTPNAMPSHREADAQTVRASRRDRIWSPAAPLSREAGHAREGPISVPDCHDLRQWSDGPRFVPPVEARTQADGFAALLVCS